MKDVLSYVIDQKILTKLTLSKPTDEKIIRTTGRLTQIKGKRYLTLEQFCTDGKAIHQNIPAQQASQVVADLIPGAYQALNIQTPAGNCEVKVSKKGKITVLDRIKRSAAATVELDHNRKKQYIIPDNQPVDFLMALGVQDENGRIFDKKRSKFRQINRFLEMVADVEGSIISGDELYILDLCCGKSYLSFAIYYYFTQIRGCKVVMDCVDLKTDVIEFCDGVAKKLHYTGLHFMAGDIRTFQIRRTPDLTVSLHACDIATDIVLAKGIDSGSRVILSTPCCHHEMMKQLDCDTLSFISDYSMLRQKLCDAATDSLRCLMLSSRGYSVEALELIDPDDTPKNLLIRAVYDSKMSGEKKEKYRVQYKNAVKFLGVDPFLSNIVNKEG